MTDFQPCEFFEHYLSRFASLDEFRAALALSSIDEFVAWTAERTGIGIREAETLIQGDDQVETQLNFDRRELYGEPFTDLRCC